jgi:hypothetical protein
MYNQSMRNKHLWLARVLIGLVLLSNLQCALVFLWHPQRYMAGFGLDGQAGMGMLRAMGLLFVMWNVPYAFALSHPLKHRLSLIEALIMQAIGLIGETLILLTGDFQDALIRASVTRFIVFDAAGLLLLGLAYLLVRGKEGD